MGASEPLLNIYMKPEKRILWRRQLVYDNPVDDVTAVHTFSCGHKLLQQLHLLEPIITARLTSLISSCTACAF